MKYKSQENKRMNTKTVLIDFLDELEKLRPTDGFVSLLHICPVHLLCITHLNP